MPAQRRKNRSIWQTLWREVTKLVLLIFVLTVVMVLPWRWLPPPTTSFMLQEIINNPEVKYEWVSLDQISPHLAIAVVASEDQKFPHHHGFDLDSIQDALNSDRKRIRGASTITQQLAKNLFLWSGRSYVRKVIEAYFSALIELLWDKKRILEVYLNVVEFGPGIYGAQAASEQLFRTSAYGLTLYQATQLAAVLPNPKLMSASTPSAYVLKRARQIRSEIDNLGGAGYLNTIYAK